MLEIRNIQKAFGDNEVLKDVPIKVEKGDVIVILGPGGSGKTTLQNVTEGLIIARKIPKQEAEEIFCHPKEERTKQFLRRILPDFDYVI